MSITPVSGLASSYLQSVLGMLGFPLDQYYVQFDQPDQCIGIVNSRHQSDVALCHNIK